MQCQIGVPASTQLAVKERLSRVVLEFTNYRADFRNGTLAQVWMPEVSPDESVVLTAQGLPFAVNSVGDLLALFRCVSVRYRFTTDSSRPAMMGAIGRVFSTLEPEMSNNVQQYDRKVYARVEAAQRCNVYSTLVMPVFEDADTTGERPLAVFELVQNSRECQFPEVISLLCHCLQKFNLHTVDSDALSLCLHPSWHREPRWKHCRLTCDDMYLRRGSTTSGSGSGGSGGCPSKQGSLSGGGVVVVGSRSSSDEDERQRSSSDHKSPAVSPPAPMLADDEVDSLAAELSVYAPPAALQAVLPCLSLIGSGSPSGDTFGGFAQTWPPASSGEHQAARPTGTFTSSGGYRSDSTTSNMVAPGSQTVPIVLKAESVTGGTPTTSGDGASMQQQQGQSLLLLRSPLAGMVFESGAAFGMPSGVGAASGERVSVPAGMLPMSGDLPHSAATAAAASMNARPPMVAIMCSSPSPHQAPRNLPSAVVEEIKSEAVEGARPGVQQPAQRTGVPLLELLTQQLLQQQQHQHRKLQQQLQQQQLQQQQQQLQQQQLQQQQQMQQQMQQQQLQQQLQQQQQRQQEHQKLQEHLQQHRQPPHPLLQHSPPQQQASRAMQPHNAQPSSGTAAFAATPGGHAAAADDGEGIGNESSDEEADEVLADAGALGTSRTAGKHISFEQLQAQFGVGLKEAAHNLNVCPSTLKRICRRYGIKCWPRRQIIKYNKALSHIGSIAGEAPATRQPLLPGQVLPKQLPALQQPPPQRRGGPVQQPPATCGLYVGRPAGGTSSDGSGATLPSFHGDAAPSAFAVQPSLLPTAGHMQAPSFSSVPPVQPSPTVLLPTSSAVQPSPMPTSAAVQPSPVPMSWYAPVPQSSPVAIVPSLSCSDHCGFMGCDTLPMGSSDSAYMKGGHKLCDSTMCAGQGGSSVQYAVKAQSSPEGSYDAGTMQVSGCLQSVPLAAVRLCGPAAAQPALDTCGMDVHSGHSSSGGDLEALHALFQVDSGDALDKLWDFLEVDEERGVEGAGGTLLMVDGLLA